MRRKYLTLAIAALATAAMGPLQAFGGDREIAEQIISRLKENRDSGALKDFTLDMKVDKGVVLLRGNVSAEEMKSLVLAAAEGIEGINEVVDEVTITKKSPPAEAVASADKKEVAPEVPAPSAPKVEVEAAAKGQAVIALAAPTAEVKPETETEPFSFKEALAVEAKIVRKTKLQPLSVVPGVVKPTSAFEDSPSDQDVVASVVGALGRAKDAGQLKGFGVDVKCNDGVVRLTGRAASKAQRDSIVRITRSAPGVASVHETISIPAPALPRRAEPQVAARMSSAPAKQLAPAPMMDPAPVMAPASMTSQVPVQVTPASAPASMPAMAAPYRMQQAPAQAMPASTHLGGGVAGQPVPMAPYAAAGAPRYDSPNLPNYAWPGYAAHPNYAALTYPQQYSPSAWPYIGPFYPYPQVPLGWRKVSLEWDDGWWFLDFTDH